MKILQIIPSLQMGGAEKFGIELSNELAKNNNEVYLCVLDEINNESMKSFINTNVKLISLQKKQGYSLKTIFDIYKLIKNIKPDIIHTHLRTLVYSLLPIVRFRIPVVHTVHNLAEKEIGTKYRKLYKLLYKLNLVTPVSISEQVLGSVKNIYGNKHLELIHNGVPKLITTNLIEDTKNEINSYKNNRETQVFLNIGRLSKQKNQLILIEAINELVEEGEDIILLVIGSLTNELEYANECKNSISKSVYLLGEKYNISDYMNYSDVFALSSIYEGLPLVILEAMSMNKMIISTPAGGVPDVVKSLNNGMITSDFSKISLKTTIKNYLKQKNNIDLNNREEFEENYSMKICQKNYYELYKKLLNTKETSFEK